MLLDNNLDNLGIAANAIKPTFNIYNNIIFIFIPLPHILYI